MGIPQILEWEVCSEVGIGGNAWVEMAYFGRVGLVTGNTGIRECFFVTLEWERWDEVGMGENGWVGLS